VDDGDRETIWATQSEMSKLFGVDQSVVSKHITNIFQEGELDELSNMQKMHITHFKPVSPYWKTLGRSTWRVLTALSLAASPAPTPGRCTLIGQGAFAMPV